MAAMRCWRAWACETRRWKADSETCGEGAGGASVRCALHVGSSLGGVCRTGVYSASSDAGREEPDA
jgi:hypothetical protein